MEGPNSPETHSPQQCTSATPDSPLFIFFSVFHRPVFASGSLSQVSLPQQPPNVTAGRSAASLLSEARHGKKKKVPRCLSLSRAFLAASLCVHPSVQPVRRSDASLSDVRAVRGESRFSDTLSSPRLLDHYYSIIGGDGGRAADA